MAIKYQAQIHKAFADSIDKEAKEKFDLLIEANPELANVADFKQSPEAAVVSSSNLKICKHFFLDEKNAFSFSNDKERRKNVAQTVKANIVAYNNFVDFAGHEKEEDFKKIYKSLIKNLDEYFSLVAEFALREKYGESYIDFAETFTKEEEKRQAARVAKRKAKSDSKSAED